MKKLKPVLLIILLGLLLAGCSNDGKEEYFTDAKKAKFDHVHGIGYPGNTKSLLVATHEGLFKYENGSWKRNTKNQHDYMGFQATKEGFYASGHPESGSDLNNPLGLVKSIDEGKRLKKLAFYGETDFHYLAASYQKGTVYVINEEPNSKLQTGLYYTKNEGKDWHQSKLEGLNSSSVGGMNVHPTKDNIIALYAKEGIFLSYNYGNTVELIPIDGIITSLVFKETSAMYSKMENNKLSLYELDLNTKKEKMLNGLSLDPENPITFIAINPLNESEIAVVTSKNDIFLTKDNGENWKKIAEEGETK
jgi:hypothetical protein